MKSFPVLLLLAVAASTVLAQESAVTFFAPLEV